MPLFLVCHILNAAHLGLLVNLFGEIYDKIWVRPLSEI